jgi:hypothetical protein
MPNVTPVWNLPYPCPGDVVSAADFLNLDVALDSALAALDAKAEERRTRPCIRWYRDTPTNIATGGTLAIIPLTVDFQVNWPVTANAPRTGLYHISAQIDAGDNTAATLSSERVTVTFGTYPAPIEVTRYNESGTDIGMWKAISGFVPLQAGEVISLSYSPTGTAGTVTITFAALQARYVMPIP